MPWDLQQPKTQLLESGQCSGATLIRAVNSRNTEASELLECQNILPKVLVLDLDYTVWPYWCDEYSATDDPPALFEEAEAIIDACRTKNILIAAASLTSTPDVARAFMHKLGLDLKFDNIQLIPAADGYDPYSARKDTWHLPIIRAATQRGYHEMLFFDDERGNVAKVSRLGVCSIHVQTSIGLCLKTFSKGLHEYAAHWQAVMLDNQCRGFSCN